MLSTDFTSSIEEPLLSCFALTTEQRHMDIDSQDQTSERAELHFLAAMVDELMKALLECEVMTRSQLQEIEGAVSTRIGTEPRVW